MSLPAAAIQVRGLGFPLNEEIIAVEVVRTLIGSVGIVLTVPITTAIAVWLLTRSSVGSRTAGRSRGGQAERTTIEINSSP